MEKPLKCVHAISEVGLAKQPNLQSGWLSYLPSQLYYLHYHVCHLQGALDVGIVCMRQNGFQERK